MTGLGPSFAFFLMWSAAALPIAPDPLTSLRAIHQLSNAEASHALPVAFEATVTYYRPYEKTMFVQDGDVAIYIQPVYEVKVSAGDRVLIKGITQPSFNPFVLANQITFLQHGKLPVPVPATFDELIRAKRDCMLVKVRAHVRTADQVTTSNVVSTTLQMNADGGQIDAAIDSSDPNALKDLLDADVEVTGAVAGHFDGKMQQTGILIHVTSLADVKILQKPAGEPWTMQMTPMDKVLTTYHVNDLTHRVRVRGTITYYQPGSMLVLQDGSRSLWVLTQTQAPLTIGNKADAVGYPGVHDGFLVLTGAEIREIPEFAPVVPLHEDWQLLTSSKHVFDLVSIDATVVAAVRQTAQDEYVLSADGELFSAIYRHPIAPIPVPAMKEVPLGSKIRVTGICMLYRSNPFDGQVPFEIRMRTFDDLSVIARPSILNVRNLSYAVSGLLLVVLVVSTWGWTMKAKVRRQTKALSARIEAEAALERRMAKLEKGRSHILEDINGARPLAEIIEQVAELESFRLHGAPCWCEIGGGARLGRYPGPDSHLRVVQMDIPARNGSKLGVLYVGFEPDVPPHPEEKEALSSGTKLAALAIETRRLYSDLRHRSEFDQLTDIHNRFSLEKYLNALIDEARETAGIFGLIYVDLDHFKQVNDVYGHRVGDLYLQEAAERMKRQLRSADMLARLGGDEFAVLLPLVGSHEHAEEVARRLERSFEEPFHLEGYTLHGSASVGIALYPEDGTNKDSLLSAADAAMYVNKHTRRNNMESSLGSREERSATQRNRG